MSTKFRLKYQEKWMLVKKIDGHYTFSLYSDPVMVEPLSKAGAMYNREMVQMACKIPDGEITLEDAGSSLNGRGYRLRYQGRWVQGKHMLGRQTFSLTDNIQDVEPKEEHQARAERSLMAKDNHLDINQIELVEA